MDRSIVYILEEAKAKLGQLIISAEVGMDPGELSLATDIECDLDDAIKRLKQTSREMAIQNAMDKKAVPFSCAL